MRRAAVLIGVNHTGGSLPVLHDAVKSARRMELWARAQGMDPVVAITDESGRPVKVAAIKAAINRVNELGTIDQLIVFFAGHGINLNYGERWLLTDAPGDSDEAVNVAASVDRARFGAIPYVVMISDACRTAAAGIQAGGVDGSSIFPNDPSADFEVPVDQFFACRLGRPAHEIADSTTTAKEYKAIYTAALIAALDGDDSTVLDTEGYVRPRPLKAFLRLELARRLRDLQLQTKLVQVPDAHIASDEEAWLSRIAFGRPPEGESGGNGGGGGAGGVVYDGTPDLPPALGAPFFGAVLDSVLGGSLDLFDDRLRQQRETASPEIAEIAASVETGASEFGPIAYETRCGFKVRGARVSEVVAGDLDAQQLSDDLVRINAPRQGGNVLLVLDRGSGITLPAIPEFIGAVTFEEGEAVDVAYEPSQGTWRWDDFTERAREVRALRAVAASASREGAFELEGEHALEIARRMQYAKGIDPALAVYAGYAYADIGRLDLIRQLHDHMLLDLEAVLFDVALLARESDGRRSRLDITELLGFAPLLAQGWALLPPELLARRPLLRELRDHVLPGSLWTLYNEDGVERIRYAIAQWEI